MRNILFLNDFSEKSIRNKTGWSEQTCLGYIPDSRVTKIKQTHSELIFCDSSFIKRAAFYPTLFKHLLSCKMKLGTVVSKP